MAAFGPVKVGDFRVAKKNCFEQKFGHVKNIEKKRVRLSAVPATARRGHPGGIKQQQQQQQQQQPELKGSNGSNGSNGSMVRMVRWVWDRTIH